MLTFKQYIYETKLTKKDIKPIAYDAADSFMRMMGGAYVGSIVGGIPGATIGTGIGFASALRNLYKKEKARQKELTIKTSQKT